MKRKLMSILLCTAMTATTVAGATTVLARRREKGCRRERMGI